MQGGLSFSTPLRSYFPFLVWDSMRQVMKGRWGSRIWSCWGREGCVSSGPLWSWVTGLTQQLAFLSWCFASSFECRRDGGGTVAGFLCPSIRKGTDPSREGMSPSCPPQSDFEVRIWKGTEAGWKGWGHQ